MMSQPCQMAEAIATVHASRTARSVVRDKTLIENLEMREILECFIDST